MSNFFSLGNFNIRIWFNYMVFAVKIDQYTLLLNTCDMDLCSTTSVVMKQL